MAQQYKNHVRFHPIYHFFTVPLIGLCLVWAIYNFQSGGLHTNDLLIALTTLLGIVAVFARMYAIKAQDRAARADERLRYYILTNKMLPKELSLGQVLALRFASDEEFAELTDRAVRESLSPKDIKQAIKNWRADYDRI